MNTRILLTGMRFHARHGVSQQEQTVGNTFIVDIQLECPLEAAMQSDNLNDTVNYGEVYAVVRRQMDVPSRLLEHVAARIIKALTDRFPQITGGRLRLEKTNPPITGFTGTAAVEICW